MLQPSKAQLILEVDDVLSALLTLVSSAMLQWMI